MTLYGWIEILLFFGLVLAATRPIGSYMYRVFEGEEQPLARLFGPIERATQRLCGVDPKEEQTAWQLSLIHI